MAAPKNNQFWKLRSKHGRDKIFATPKLLWEAACEYFEWCEKNPLIEIDFKGSGARKVNIPHMRPFTIQGLCLYVDCGVDFFRNFKNDLPEKDKDFLPIIEAIEQTIYNQKFSGAAAGFLNPNIIARDLGLKDSIDHTTKGDKIQQPPPINVFNTAPPLAGSEDKIDGK
jgi:hypothetical protein